MECTFTPLPLGQRDEKLVDHIKENDWSYVMRMLKTMQSMQEYPKLAGKVSLNKATFVLDKDIKEEKAKGPQKHNAPRYKDIWHQYRGVAHLIEALQIMKMQYLEWAGDPIPFEVFLALVLDHLNLAAYQQGEELKKMQEGHTKKPIVPADEFYVIEKPKRTERAYHTPISGTKKARFKRAES